MALSRIVALIPVWQALTPSSSTNYLFGTGGSSQIPFLCPTMSRRESSKGECIELHWDDVREGERWNIIRSLELEKKRGKKDHLTSQTVCYQHLSLCPQKCGSCIWDAGSGGELLLQCASPSLSSILQKWKRKPPSFPLWLPNEILYLWHPALSPRTKPFLRQQGRQSQETESQWGGGWRGHLCLEDLFPALTSCFVFFFQMGRWIVCLLEHCVNVIVISSSSGGRIMLIHAETNPYRSQSYTTTLSQ